MTADPFAALLAFAPPGASLGMPTTFVEWCDWAGVPLTEGQAALARVAFDGGTPTSELERQLFGTWDSPISVAARALVAMRLGRGSGKSHICAAYGVFRMVTGDTSACGPGDYPAVGVVSTDQGESKQVVAKALAIIKGKPELAAMLRSETTTEFHLVRADGVRVRFVTRVAHSKGKGARGPSWLLFVIDEAEFLDPSGADATARVEELARSAGKRRLKGGAVVLCSTPWPVESYVSKLFDANYGKPVYAVCALGPTLLLRDSEETRAQRDADMAADPAAALREYDCIITDVSGAFFEASTIDAAISATALRARFQRVSTGIDLAFVRDAAANVTVERQAIGARVQLAVTRIELLDPRKLGRLKPSETVAAFVAMAREDGATAIVADGHYVELVREHAAHPDVAMSVVAAPTTMADLAAADLYLRDLFREGLILLPPGDVRIIGQLKSVLAKALPGGTLRAFLPRRAGSGHADLYAALRNAVWYDRRHGPLLRGHAMADTGQPIPETFSGGWTSE